MEFINLSTVEQHGFTKLLNVYGDIEFKPGDHTIMYASSVPYGGTVY